MWPQITSMLSTAQWIALGAVPFGILLLYFLKLRRKPLEVPSTFLWLKMVEDMHVNSIWQRLRQNLLLFLQILLVLLLILALIRPSWQGSKLQGGRYIFLVDNSASMTATDVEPTRLEEAKRRVAELIDEMRSGDEALIVSFSDSARVEQGFTDNRRELRKRLAAIKTTEKPTSIVEALRVAAGLAVGGRSAMQEERVIDVKPASLYIFSDGRFPDVKGFSMGSFDPNQGTEPDEGATPDAAGKQETSDGSKPIRGMNDFSLGSLDPQPISLIGEEDADNVAILAFSTGRNEEKPDQVQAIARIKNFGKSPVDAEGSLWLDGEMIDAKQFKLKADEALGLPFDLDEHVTHGVLELRLDVRDAFALDNRAWTVINPARRSRVLLITPGNEPLNFVFSTARAVELAEVTQQPPGFLDTPDYTPVETEGTFDLVIYDRCRPKQMPRANTLFIGQIPPAGAWQALDKVSVPQIIDTERSHPLMQLVDMSDVLIAEARALQVPPGATVLIESASGPLFAVASREAYQDAVLGVEIESDAGVTTNWPVRISFPVFALNILSHLGGTREALDNSSLRPGQPFQWRGVTGAKRASIKPPRGNKQDVPRGQLDMFNFIDTSQLGAYEVREEKQETATWFAVNLFDANESNLRPRNSVLLGSERVEGTHAWEPTRRDAWKWLLLVALAILALEWYIYNRRVYI